MNHWVESVIPSFAPLWWFQVWTPTFMCKTNMGQFSFCRISTNQKRLQQQSTSHPIRYACAMRPQKEEEEKQIDPTYLKSFFTLPWMTIQQSSCALCCATSLRSKVFFSSSIFATAADNSSSCFPSSLPRSIRPLPAVLLLQKARNHEQQPSFWPQKRRLQEQGDAVATTSHKK